MEQEIIQPIAKEILKSELTRDRQLRMTNKSHNEIYVVTAHNAPNVMKEIGRLREIAFERRVEALVNRWISMNSIPVKIATSN